MRIRRLPFLLGSLGLLLAPSAASAAGPAPQAVPHIPACPGSGAGDVRCFARVVTDRGGSPDATASPTGLRPIDITTAYNWTSGGDGTGTTIAIVDAYDDPTAEKDLGVFSSTFGLPQCTTANGCFAKVNQNGATNPRPKTDAGWALEISLDVQWAHAVAPNAHILLVEASSASITSLLAAEDTAHRLGATVVSNSWGANEFSSEASYDFHFTGKTFVSSGDSGYGAEWPSSSPNVTSVGGTKLLSWANTVTSSTETGWTGSGGGCSLYEPATANGGSGLCGSKRATPDIAADADPASGVSVYDSTRYQGQLGWFRVGGTSLASPLWAARTAAAGAASTYNDIVSGCNSSTSCATAGYDLVTGIGSRIG